MNEPFLSKAPLACEQPLVTILATSKVGDDHAVSTIKGGNSAYRKKPCSDCPWKVSSTGVFPAMAFEHSAITAFDMSSHQFGCHQSGVSKPAACAGFLLAGSAHNLATRLARIKGEVKNDVQNGGNELYPSYREMAIGNGVSPDNPILSRCR